MKKTILLLTWMILVLAIPVRAEVALDIKLNFFAMITV